ncbi:MAG: HTTM domain-containing protein [Pseudomonadota bacterium]
MLHRLPAVTPGPHRPGTRNPTDGVADTLAHGNDIAAADLQSLSLFRIGFALYLLGDFIVNSWPFFDDFYGADGILPLAALAVDPRLTSIGLALPLLGLVEAAGLPTIFPILYVVALAGFGIGYRTRWSAALLFVLNSFLYWRNPLITSGAEVLAHLLLLWSLFLPMNRYWGVDAALDPAPRDRPYPTLPFLAIRLQIASLYLFSALFKMAGPPWRDGSALIQALSDNVFGVMPASGLLVDHAGALLHPLTFAVVAFQLAFPLLVYCPWRNDIVRAIALAAAALMHLSFIVVLHVGGFPYICLAMLLLLVPDSWLDRMLQRRRARLARVVIFYDPDCGFCRRVALLLREAALPPATPVLPATDDAEAQHLLTTHQSWVVRGADGALHLKWRAVAYVLKQSPLLAPLGWLTDAWPARAMIARLYDAIGANRQRLGPLAARLLPFRSDRPIGRPALALCGLLMLFGFISNLASVARLSITVPPAVDQLTDMLQVHQSWELFAPRPTHWRRDFRLLAVTADGATADLNAQRPAPLFRSVDGALEFASHRWLKFFTQLDQFPKAQRDAFGDYLCRQAQRQDRGASLREVAFHETKQLIEPSGAPARDWVYDYRFACAS